MLNLSTILETSARDYPTKSAFTFMDTTLNFAQINGAANQVANGLIAKGIKKGDKVALSCFNLPFFPIIYFGILKAGAIVVPLSVLLKSDEIQYHLTDSEAKAYFCFVGSAELPMGKMGYEGFLRVDNCEQMFMIMPSPEMTSPIDSVPTLGSLMAGQSAAFEMVRTGADDTAIIIYTSGTTGKPKGAELTHSNLMMNVIVAEGLMNLTNKDVVIIVLPLFHIFAMTVLMNAGIYKGAHSVLLPRFNANATLGLMEKYGVTVFAGVPTMFWALNEADTTTFDINIIKKNLRSVASGGASLPVAVLEKFEKLYEVPILEGYGMSEGSPIVTFNQINVGRKPGSIGTPVWGVEVKLVNDKGIEVALGEKGELVYRGHNVMKGYYKKPEANAKTIKNGWLYSGDIAIKDKDGFFFIVDRTKDMIIRGGLNVYPRELEEVMIKHEAISMVAVIGTPHERMGEEVKACVVLNKGCVLSDVELIAWTKERIASYKYPRIIQFLDALPLSATGKILKKELRKM